jgi:hypothetical protein
VDRYTTCKVWQSLKSAARCSNNAKFEEGGDTPATETAITAKTDTTADAGKQPPPRKA